MDFNKLVFVQTGNLTDGQFVAVTVRVRGGTILSATFFAGQVTWDAGVSGKLFAIPINATLIGFKFYSDGLVNAEGAYIDEVRVFGGVLPVTCSAEVDIVNGVEWSTVFKYSAHISGGLPPYALMWDFADGLNSTSATPAHTFYDIGNFTASFNVRDVLGQTCRATSPTVVVMNDISTVSITPGIATVVEGSTTLFLATDARGRPLDFTWSITPSSCGSFDTTSGSVVNFMADIEAGGTTCTLRASYSTATTTAKITVDHDISSITVSPTLPP